MCRYGNPFVLYKVSAKRQKKNIDSHGIDRIFSAMV
jgi:hypothetical protein